MAIFKSSTKGELEAKKWAEWAKNSQCPKNYPAMPTEWGKVQPNVKTSKHHKSA